jgi:uncharacterized protein (DUF779 family)
MGRAIKAGRGFSLPAGDNGHFITRSRVFSAAELAILAEGERRS